MKFLELDTPALLIDRERLMKIWRTCSATPRKTA